HFMDGGSCGLEGASVVTSTTSAGIQLLPEKHCTDEACGAMAGSNGPEGVPVVTSADDPPTHADIPFLCNSVDETCEATGDGSAPLDAQICTGFSKLISLEVMASRVLLLSGDLCPYLRHLIAYLACPAIIIVVIVATAIIVTATVIVLVIVVRGVDAHP
ncbi:hypothetical protein ACJX0J_033535, partial [Zea mays]